MRHLIYLSAAVLLVSCVVRPAAAEPAWGRNCMSCHDQLLTDTLFVFGEDTFADPDESATGAPDRGTLPVFQTSCAATKSLQVLVSGLLTDDTYAVELKRLRYPGVEGCGELSYTGDCDWPEWGEYACYYTEPVISYRWGVGPEEFAFDIDVEADADGDYYDLVFAVTGKFTGSGELFYAEQHFYLQVIAIAGDINCDGTVNITDLAELLGVYSTCDGEADYLPAADLDDDGCISSGDLAILLTYYGTSA